MNKLTEQEKLDKGIKIYVDAWFSQLLKKEKTDANLKALDLSYKWIAEQAVKSYIENKNEQI